MPSGNLARLTVLVVDNHVHMMNIVKAILRGFGIKDILQANDGAEAFRTIQSTPVDLVITDFPLRSMNGFEFIRRIRDADDSPNPFLPVVMLTAYSERSMVEKARDAGVTEFCAKPVTPRDLYRKISSIVNKPRAFARAGGYFGPDRRRRPDKEPATGERRDKRDDVHI